MPELPEVEVTRRGIAPGLVGRRIDAVSIRNSALRWPVLRTLPLLVAGLEIKTVDRRGKFILIDCRDRSGDGSASATSTRSAGGTLLIHLGMTGTLRLMSAATPLRPHDHVDFVVGDRVLRYNDPRRFGAVLWHDASDGPVAASLYLARLGVEPLSAHFLGAAGGRLLHGKSRGKTVAIKQLLLAGEVVVGVGNIYASESLFHARIDPRTAAGRIALKRYARLADAIRATLSAAIEKGGSTLRDFVGGDGAPGYFQQDYFVYDRAGRACRVCATPIRALRQGQRSTFFCPRCQR